MQLRIQAVGAFTNTSNSTVDQRKGADRRTETQKRPYDRRTRPDRRLNNISAEWIPFTEVTSHPTIREALNSRTNKTKSAETHKKEQWHIKQSVLNIFKNKFSASVDLRKVSDRRTQNQKRPYDRRTRPDRRLNNISVEWIPY